MSSPEFETGYPLIMAVQYSNALTAKFGSPVTKAQPPQAIAPAHTRGYLITGGVKSPTMPLTPATKALVRLGYFNACFRKSKC